MIIRPAIASDVESALDCLVRAFAEDPITGFLLGTGPGYPGRLRRFFSLLLRARIAIGAPALVAEREPGIVGATMGYATTHPAWPADVAEEWDRFERDIDGLVERMAVYDGIAAIGKPAVPHYYLGVIGSDLAVHGSGVGRELLHAFCSLSAEDPASAGVYLETANPSNVRFYERDGFEEVARGNMGSATLWCMLLRHPRRDGG